MFLKLSVMLIGILWHSIYLIYINELDLEHKYTVLKSVVAQILCPPPPHSSANHSPNKPKGKSGKSPFIGHVLQLLVLSGANKPLSASRLVSLLSTSSGLEIDFFCLGLKDLLPCHCLSSVRMCACVCTFLHAAERARACVH